MKIRVIWIVGYAEIEVQVAGVWDVSEVDKQRICHAKVKFQWEHSIEDLMIVVPTSVRGKAESVGMAFEENSVVLHHGGSWGCRANIEVATDQIAVILMEDKHGCHSSVPSRQPDGFTFHPNRH